jgi:hypothetical protein
MIQIGRARCPAYEKLITCIPIGRVHPGYNAQKVLFFYGDELWSHKVERELQLPSTKAFRGFMVSLIDNPNDFCFSEVIAIIKPFQ